MIDPTQNATQRYHLNGLVHKGMFIFFLLTYLSSVSQEIEVPQTKCRLRTSRSSRPRTYRGSREFGSDSTYP